MRELNPHYHKEYMRDWRDKKRARGLCTRCGDTKASKGMMRCKECARIVIIKRRLLKSRKYNLEFSLCIGEHK
jgi:tRNA(Ile2) C34 agmatinyltransferase TiaS